MPASNSEANINQQPRLPSQNHDSPYTLQQLSSLSKPTKQVTINTSNTQQSSSRALNTLSQPRSITIRTNLFNTIFGATSIVITVFFGIYSVIQAAVANKAAKLSNDIAYKSLTLSRWQTCMQYPNAQAVQTSNWCQIYTNLSLDYLFTNSTIGLERSPFIAIAGPGWELANSSTRARHLRLAVDILRALCIGTALGYSIHVLTMRLRKFISFVVRWKGFERLFDDAVMLLVVLLAFLALVGQI